MMIMAREMIGWIKFYVTQKNCVLSDYEVQVDVRHFGSGACGDNPTSECAVSSMNLDTSIV